jgi:hypothetical protein
MQAYHLSLIDSLHGETRRSFYEHHQLLARAMHIILPLSPFVGMYFMEAVGGVLGLTLFLLGYYLMPYAWSATHDHRLF